MSNGIEVKRLSDDRGDYTKSLQLLQQKKAQLNQQLAGVERGIQQIHGVMSYISKTLAEHNGDTENPQPAVPDGGAES